MPHKAHSYFSKTNFAAAALAGVSLLALNQSALAGAFALREQSAAGLGVSFAGVAAGSGGLSSMFWNPATITDLNGIQSTAVLSGILPYANNTPDAVATSSVLTTLLGGGTAPTGNIGQSAVVPSGYFSYQLNDKIWLGLSINSPFGLVTANPKVWAGQTYARTSKVFSADISPTIAFKVNEQFSIAAGLQAEYFKTRLTSAASNVVGTNILEGDAWGFGYTLGATYKPMAGTEIGVGYRSRVTQDLKGTEALAVALGGGLIPAGVYSISSNLVLPDSATFGVRQRINDQWTVNLGYEWTHWKLFNSFPVTGPVPGQALSFGYKNGWVASLGAEYQWNPNLTVRAGAAFESSPIDITNRAVRVPDTDRIWLTTGLGYKLSQKLSMDLGYAHIFGRQSGVDIVSGNPAYSASSPYAYVGTVKAHVDIISLGINYRWDEPAVTGIKGPIVRK